MSIVMGLIIVFLFVLGIGVVGAVVVSCMILISVWYNRILYFFTKKDKYNKDEVFEDGHEIYFFVGIIVVLIFYIIFFRQNILDFLNLLITYDGLRYALLLPLIPIYMCVAILKSNKISSKLAYIVILNMIIFIFDFVNSYIYTAFSHLSFSFYVLLCEVIFTFLLVKVCKIKLDLDNLECVSLFYTVFITIMQLVPVLYFYI